MIDEYENKDQEILDSVSESYEMIFSISF